MGSSHLGGGAEVLFISRGRVVTGASCDLQTRFGPIMKDTGLITSRRVKRVPGSLPAESLGSHLFPVSHPFDCLPFGVNIIVIGVHFPCASYVVDGGKGSLSLSPLIPPYPSESDPGLQEAAIKFVVIGAIHQMLPIDSHPKTAQK